LIQSNTVTFCQVWFSNRRARWRKQMTSGQVVGYGSSDVSFTSSSPSAAAAATAAASPFSLSLRSHAAVPGTAPARLTSGHILRVQISSYLTRLCIKQNCFPVDNIEIFKILNGNYSVDRDLFFAANYGGRRGQSRKLFKRRCRLDIRKICYSNC